MALEEEMKKLEDKLGKLLKVAKDGKALQKQTVDGLKKFGKATVGAAGGLAKMAVGGILNKIVDALFSFPPELKKIEQFGARFSKSFEQSFKESKKLSDTIGGGVDVYDAFIFQLNMSRRGLDENSAAMQDLMAITGATGENITELVTGLQSATAGMGNNSLDVLTLNRTMEITSRSFNRSRVELVKAMNKVSQTTLNMLAFAGVQGTTLQDTMTILKGLVPDQALFGQTAQAFQKLLSPAGLRQALALGFDSSKIFSSQATMADNLAALLNLGDKGLMFQRQLVNLGRATPAAVGALQHTFGELGLFIRNANQMRMMAEKQLGVTIRGTNEQVAANIIKAAEKAAAENDQFHNTIKRIQNEILRPLKNGMAEVGLQLKGLLEASAGGLRKIVQTITSGLMLVMGALLDTLTWFVSGDMDKELHAAKNGIMGIRKSFDAEGLQASRQRAKLIKNSDDQKPLRDTLKKANLFAVRQTDALLGQIYQAMLQNNNLVQLGNRIKVVPVGTPGGGSSPGGARMPVRGGK